MLKKIWKFLSSMRFALILLVLLAAFCAVGSFITQNQPLSYYTEQYSEQFGALIVALGFDRIFSNWWFFVAAGLLVASLVFCSVSRLPGLIKRLKNGKDGSTGKLGTLGSWITHFGILVLIVGFTLGQVTKTEYTVYGLPGDVKPLGDTGIMVSINDFTITMNDDDTVDQYTASITAFREDNILNAEGAVVEVNHPATLFGYRFYQNSTGYAALLSVYKDEALIDSRNVYAGESVTVGDRTDLILRFAAFYPDYYSTESGPATRSGTMKNPGYVYMLYHNNELLGMNVLTGDEKITVDQYTITFTDPKYYTLLQVKRDDFTWIALVGGVIILMGLFLSFYVPKKKEGTDDPCD